jgi:glycosyltransferase involved in cell wall biosynthesis
VEHGVNGYLVNIRDPEGLAEAMLNLARSPETAAAMGLKSFEMARDKFDVHAVNRLLLEQMELD